ncbi:class I SAM-dependent methyltransferase [bacterium]|nr:class I SAM-dependent methyltransferase [bacterium]
MGQHDESAAQVYLPFRQVYPDLRRLIDGKRVVDFGCGEGHHAVAMAREGADRVLGVDIDTELLETGHRVAREAGVAERVRFATEPRETEAAGYDVVLSLNSMEHFGEPAAALEKMMRLLKPGGHLLISFDPTWYSPWGGHMHYFISIPWVHLLFPESTVMKVRARFRDDGATRYEDVPGGLNRMSVTRFKKLMQDPRLELRDLDLVGVRHIPLFGKLPLLRELLVPRVVCTAALRGSAEARPRAKAMAG